MGQHTGYTRRGGTVKTTAVSLHWFGLCNNSIEVSIGIFKTYFVVQDMTHIVNTFLTHIQKSFTNFKIIFSQNKEHVTLKDVTEELNYRLSHLLPQIVVYCQIYKYFDCICQN